MSTAQYFPYALFHVLWDNQYVTRAVFKYTKIFPWAARIGLNLSVNDCAYATHRANVAGVRVGETAYVISDEVNEGDACTQYCPIETIDFSGVEKVEETIEIPGEGSGEVVIFEPRNPYTTNNPDVQAFIAVFPVIAVEGEWDNAAGTMAARICNDWIGGCIDIATISFNSSSEPGAWYISDYINALASYEMTRLVLHYEYTWGSPSLRVRVIRMVHYINPAEFNAACVADAELYEADNEGATRVSITTRVTTWNINITGVTGIERVSLVAV